MDLWEVLILSVGLAMDAFAVSVCKGLAMSKVNINGYGAVALWFGGFQGIMPLIGYLLGTHFAVYINKFSAWIAFILLVLIGANMIKESFSKKEKDEGASLSFKNMFVLALATSIDALAVGITFACVPVTVFVGSAFANTFTACLIIAGVTAAISAAGLKIGNIFGAKYKNKAEFAGGLILILLGLKILLQHFTII